MLKNKNLDEKNETGWAIKIFSSLSRFYEYNVQYAAESFAYNCILRQIVTQSVNKQALSLSMHLSEKEFSSWGMPKSVQKDAS